MCTKQKHVLGNKVIVFLLFAAFSPQDNHRNYLKQSRLHLEGKRLGSSCGVGFSEGVGGVAMCKKQQITPKILVFCFWYVAPGAIIYCSVSTSIL